MRVNTERTAGVSTSTMAAFMLAVFTVSVGVGVVLPLLPYLIERLLGAGVAATQVSRHTNLLTAVRVAPIFGHSRVGRKYARGCRSFLLLRGAFSSESEPPNSRRRSTQKCSSYRQ